MMEKNTRKWIFLSVLNLLIVALIGVLMRYKITYSFPWAEQKNLLHAHSHFAFAGWVTQALMSLMVYRLSRSLNTNRFSSYRAVLTANLICAYGMLLSFPFQGYGAVSIFFSSASLLTGFWFTIKFWQELRKVSVDAGFIPWFKAALFFNVISAAGTIYLAYMMATHTATADRYLASIYYYLHFQYNGWFFFACMGLIAPAILKPLFSGKEQRIIFWLFAGSCIPAYFLSALWLPIPVWVYVLVVGSALAQLLAWILIVRKIWPSAKSITRNTPSPFWWLLVLSAIALSIKLLLQLGSTHPELSKLAFGFRPIVIGYLHLVLLGVISLFILGYCFINSLLSVTKTSKAGLYIFLAGIVLNEVLLMVQGMAAIRYMPVPYVNELLLLAAVTLATGAAALLAGNSFSGKQSVTASEQHAKVF